MLAERLGDGEMIDLPVSLEQLFHRREHRSVLVAIEVLGSKLLLDQQRIEVAIVEQDSAERRPLGLEVMRGDRCLLDGGHGRGRAVVRTERRG